MTYIDRYRAGEHEAVWAELKSRGLDAQFGGYIIEVAPDDCHKAGLSGGGPYYLALPAQSVDGRLHGDQSYGDFIDYLREVFRWGGFPGIARSTVCPREQLDFLVESLVPL